MNTDLLLTEFDFTAVKSGGPGGQHANKTASKVKVAFNIKTSQALSDKEKERLLHRLSNKLDSDGTLHMECSETRSQHRNKTLVIERLVNFISHHLQPKKKRKKTKKPRRAIEKRLREKKKQAMKKKDRKPPKLDR
ncbi:alternative ribosome rescue aminoacyl-tRNA hydrolase ArfB [Luteirhabdus pelagi]|uniref:alternative ribosome rescue aminoacyl-tRNA hydrolase ArfB n=1 Tax=Luteirhabdus pelagi TaxID=2792783 RepID=UPI00193A0879|nr:alternative ribosome rescue aminoacyl-tRNA hydrolase ArfB [Luteirhabdus pelagi]